MISKDEAHKAGLGVVDASGNDNPRLAQFKSLFPEAINSDGRLDTQALHNLLQEKAGVATSPQGQSYGLNFAGKGLARIKADEPTKKELHMDDKQSKDFDKTSNVIIRGDNLDALKILRQNYTSKVKMIYIDPPYNTGSANFVYKDNFRDSEAGLVEKYGIDEDAINFFDNVFGTKTHSGWLHAMYPRLKLARDLLTDDGVIFISINDIEMANLKLICDEIYGEENFRHNLSVVNSLNGNDNSSGMTETQEWCLIYSKSASFEFGVLSVDDDEANGWEEDEIGLWKEGGNLQASGRNAAFREDRPHLYFPIYINTETLQISLSRESENDFELLPKKDGRDGRWYWQKSKFATDKDEVIVKKTNGGYSLYKKQRPTLGDLPTKLGKTTFYKPSYSTATAAKQIRDVFGGRVFDTTKALDLIKDFIRLANTSEGDIILDFFAGSGTTAHAVMDINSEDGKKHKFILVQWDEEIETSDTNGNIPYEFCKQNNFAPVISSLCIERVNRAGEMIAQHASLNPVDIGYKVFSLTDRPRTEEDKSGKAQLPNLKNRTAKNALYNMMAASGHVLLTDAIDEVKKDAIFKVGDHYFVVGDVSDEKDREIFADAKGYIYLDAYATANTPLDLWLNLFKRSDDLGEFVKIIY